MTAALYLFGAVLLAAAGACGGTCLALRARRRWQDAHAFGRLLDYLHGAIRYRTLTGGEVLQKAAAYPEFARLGLEHCHRLGRLVPPDAFEPALRQELCADLEALESAPRDTACALPHGGPLPSGRDRPAPAGGRRPPAVSAAGRVRRGAGGHPAAVTPPNGKENRYGH